MLRKLTPPAPLPTAADRRLGRSARIWTGGAAAFSQAVRDRWDLGLDGLYPDAPLVFLEAEEDRQLPPAGEVHLTQFTLRLLIQLSETIAAGRTPAAAMEQSSLDDSIRHCLTALETQNRESCRELQTLRTRLIAVSALPGRQKKTELAAVRETAERRLAQSVSRNAAAAGDFARTAEEAGPAAPGSRAAEVSPAAGTKRRGRAQKPDLAGKPAGEKPGETAPQALFARPAGTLPGREPSPEPAAARRLGGARRIAQTISFLQALPAYGGLTAYRRFSEPEQSRLAAQNLRRETLIALLSAAPPADREAVWQAAELSLAHFPQTAGDNPAAHTPERLAAGLRTGTDKEWTRLLRTAERRLTTAEAAPAAPAPSEENRAALAAAAPLLRTLHRALAVKPLDRKSLAAEVRSALPPGPGRVLAPGGGERRRFPGPCGGRSGGNPAGASAPGPQGPPAGAGGAGEAASSSGSGGPGGSGGKGRRGAALLYAGGPADTAAPAGGGRAAPGPEAGLAAGVDTPAAGASGALAALGAPGAQ
jgi:hypothetical protein